MGWNSVVFTPLSHDQFLAVNGQIWNELESPTPTLSISSSLCLVLGDSDSGWLTGQLTE